MYWMFGERCDSSAGWMIFRRILESSNTPGPENDAKQDTSVLSSGDSVCTCLVAPIQKNGGLLLLFF